MAHLQEDLVALEVPEAVVDGFQVVDVEIGQGELVRSG